MSSGAAAVEERVLVLAPLWRDSEVTCRVLGAAGFDCLACADIEALQDAMTEGAAAVVVTQEAMGEENRALLLAQLERQPPWSDLPVIVLLAPGSQPLQRAMNAGDILPELNATLLRRPVSSATLVSVVNASLRARRRQYLLRAHMRERESYAEKLEQRVRRRTRKLQRMSDQYEAARDLFFALFQANPLPITIVRLEDGFFLDANDAFLRYFEMERDAVVGRRLSVLQERLPQDLSMDILRRLQRFGAVRNLEATISEASGITRTVLVSAELVTLQGAEAALVTFVNISERKEAEEKIRALASKLARAEHQERHRISHILHDGLQQQLYGLQMQLSFLRDDASEAVLRELDAIDGTMGDAIKIVRDLSVDLSPPILYDEGLVQGIRWIANRMQEQYRFKVNIEADHAFPVEDDGMRVLLFQTVRELLFNAVKHAGVSEVSVAIRSEGERLRIDVVDKGVGFDPGALEHDIPSTSSHGLRTTLERLRLIGGQLEIHSTPGQGTSATIYAPAL